MCSSFWSVMCLLRPAGDGPCACTNVVVGRVAGKGGRLDRGEKGVPAFAGGTEQAVELLFGLRIERYCTEGGRYLPVNHHPQVDSVIRETHQICDPERGGEFR